MAIDGNGKPGLKDDLRSLEAAHDELDRAFAEYIKMQTKDAEEKKTDTKDRDKEYLKWRLGIAAVIIAAFVTTALGVFQSYIVAQLVNTIK